VSPEPTHILNQGRVRNFIFNAANGCGDAVNSFLLALGDRHRLHTTGSYSCVADPLVRCQETAFMTLICHECAAATDSHQATP
jgi:hypothetical protein